MKTLIVILIIASFLQTTILPIDLVLMILICRSYIKISPSNLYLAFIFGILISHLNLVTLGLNSLIFIACVQITQGLSKTRLAGNSLLIIPITFVLLSFSGILTSVFLNQSLEIFHKVLLESLISLPILYALKVWEERFIVRGDIKLKM